MMQTGDFNPHFFEYPSLYMYVQLATACARFLFGAVHGEWVSLSQVGPENFYLWGRAVSAAIGVATTALVYICGTYWSRAHAGVAAAFIAVFPLHVRESHYVLTDVPATFFVALTLFLALRASYTPSTVAFAAAGAASGLAMATKYNAFLAIMVPLVVAAAAGFSARARLSYGAVVLVSAGVCFLLAAPYTILDLPAFLNGFAALSKAYAKRVGQEAGWIVYLKHLKLAMGSGGLLLLFAGFVLSLVSVLRRPMSAQHWALLVFPAVYFAFVSRQGLIFGRYLLPLAPFIALFLAVAILGIGDVLRRFGVVHRHRIIVMTVVTLLALWPQIHDAVAFNRQNTRPSTHAIAYQWLIKNVRPGSKVVSERYEIRLPERLYRVTGERRLIDRSYDEYVRAGTDYLIASSHVFGPVLNSSGSDLQSRQAYEQLFSQAREVFRVAPGDRRVGPEIRVYSIKAAGQ